MTSFAKRLWEITCVLGFSIVIGAGFGFVQGLAAFGCASTTERLEFSSWAALMGGGVSILFGPILYFWLIRRSLGLETLGQIILISLIAGIGTAVVLRLIGDGGWLSCLITPVVTLLVTINFRKQIKS